MKNLFKTLITVITVVCMLVTCTTAFAAATANTVTQYLGDSSVKVTSTISGVASGTMVTYLAGVDGNDEGTTLDAYEIKYINQYTSDGSDIPVEYSITGNGWTAGTQITEVKYGSDNSTVATELNAADTTNDVLYDDIDITVTVNGDAAPNDYTNYVTVAPAKIGNADEVDVAFAANAGYQITSIKINNVDVGTSTLTHKVAYNQPVVVDVEPIDSVKVYLLNAEVTDGLKVYDATTSQELTVVTGVGYYTGSVKEVGIDFGDTNIDGEHEDGKYEAVLENATAQAGYFAVQLAGTDMTGVAATAAYAIDANDAEVVSANY